VNEGEWEHEIAIVTKYENLVPRAYLLWTGPGWYAAKVVKDTSYIDLVGDFEGWRPPSPEGYGTVYWASTKDEALGNYA
jgi:hypothetical protein